MQKAGVSPDAEVFVHRIQLVETHHPHGMTCAFLSLASDLGYAIRSVKLEASGQNFLAVSASSTSQLKNAAARR